jgi:hypothetical protein
MLLQVEIYRAGNMIFVIPCLPCVRVAQYKTAIRNDDMLIGAMLKQPFLTNDMFQDVHFLR